MTITYWIEQKGEIVYAIGHGTEDNLEQNKEITQTLIRACEEHRCSLLLVDDRDVKYTASILSLYELGEFYKTTGASRKVKKVAVLADSSYKESNDFFETTSRNRGVNLRVFYQMENAEAWLLEKQI